MFNECRHIKPSGVRCKAPALKDKAFCYHHFRWRSRGAGPAKGRPKKSLQLASLEDMQGIQIALMQVMDALGSNSLDDKRAGRYLYGLQIATQLASRISVPAPADVVRSISIDEATGEILAPESVQCDPGAECNSCPTRDQCVRPDRPPERSPLSLLIDKWENEPEWEDPDASEPEELTLTAIASAAGVPADPVPPARKKFPKGTQEDSPGWTLRGAKGEPWDSAQHEPQSRRDDRTSLILMACGGTPLHARLPCEDLPRVPLFRCSPTAPSGQREKPGARNTLPVTGRQLVRIYTPHNK